MGQNITRIKDDPGRRLQADDVLLFSRDDEEAIVRNCIKLRRVAEVALEGLAGNPSQTGWPECQSHAVMLLPVLAERLQALLDRFKADDMQVELSPALCRPEDHMLGVSHEELEALRMRAVANLKRDA